MSHSLTAIVGLGIVLGSAAPAQPEPVPSSELAEVEVAPGASIPSLAAPYARVPSFVLIDEGVPSATAQAEVPAALTIGTSGLAAFGAEGIRMPAYEPPEIPTGSVTRIKRR